VSKGSEVLPIGGEFPVREHLEREIVTRGDRSTRS